MKRQLLNWKTRVIFIATVLLSLNNLYAQTVVDFEDLTLDEDTCWYGRDGEGSFTSGDVNFENSFTDYGFPYYAWGGFAYSNKTDNTTPGYTNDFTAFTGSGYNNSSTYALAYLYPSAMLKFKDNVSRKVKGFYVTNTTFAALYMKTGDDYFHKPPYGGEDGNTKDSLVLTIKGYLNGSPKTDTVNFVLADYRFDDNSKDYLVDSWQWVELSSLGEVDSLKFFLSTSDDFTPTYFAMDNLTIEETITAMESDNKVNFAIFPNPVASSLSLDLTSLLAELTQISISDVHGLEVFHTSAIAGNKLNISVEALTPGVYIISVKQNDKINSLRLIKQ